MRELKFRAWDKSVEHLYEVQTLIDGGDAIGRYVLNGEMRYIHLCADEIIVEQYTGLKDKNGKEIYEGDVLESTWNGDKAVVVWNNVEGEWEHYADFNTYSKYGGSVVIGNIHENPELLEKEEE